MQKFIKQKKSLIEHEKKCKGIDNLTNNNYITNNNITNNIINTNNIYINNYCNESIVIKYKKKYISLK